MADRFKGHRGYSTTLARYKKISFGLLKKHHSSASLKTRKFRFKKYFFVHSNSVGIVFSSCLLKNCHEYESPFRHIVQSLE